MVYCDKNENILEWGSEEIFLPYRSPVDNRIHRYFPDFYIKVKESTGHVKKYLIEAKPKKQCVEPKPQKRKQKVISTKFMNMLEIKQNGKQQESIVLTECEFKSINRRRIRYQVNDIQFTPQMKTLLLIRGVVDYLILMRETQFKPGINIRVYLFLQIKNRQTY